MTAVRSAGRARPAAPPGPAAPAGRAGRSARAARPTSGRYGPLPPGRPGPAGPGGRAGPGGQAQLIASVERAGLTGRGGAAFPAARKMRAVAGAAARTGRGRRRGGAVLIANGAESEPASGKDAILLRQSPHLVLDGIALAAGAVGAALAYLCVDGADPGTARPAAGGGGRTPAGRPGRAGGPRRGGSRRLRGQRGVRPGEFPQRGPGGAAVRAAAAVRAGSRRPGHPGEQRRDAGAHRADRPVRPGLVRRGRHARRTRLRPGHGGRGGGTARRLRDRPGPAGQRADRAGRRPGRSRCRPSWRAATSAAGCRCPRPRRCRSARRDCARPAPRSARAS